MNEKYERYNPEKQTAAMSVGIRSAGQAFNAGEAMRYRLEGEQLRVFRLAMARVFLWMFIGLALSAASALATYMIPAVAQVTIFNPVAYIVLAIGSIVLAVSLSATVWRARPIVSKALFMVYSLVMGVMLSTVFFYYTADSILYSFVGAAAVFGGMALFGYLTRMDLRPVGYVGGMLLFGAIIITLLNLLLYYFAPGTASTLTYIMNYVILAIFIGLTAYDMQRIKMMVLAATETDGQYTRGMGTFEGQKEVNSARGAAIDQIAIMGALTLYLDFINIFLRILAIFGKRKN